MEQALGRLADLLGAFSRVALWVAAAGLVVMTAAIGWQIFGRFVLNAAPTWTEPVSLLLMVYYILLAAAVGVRERFHLSLDLFRQLAPEGVRRVFDGVTHIVVGAFGVAMAWYGTGLVRSTWNQTIAVVDLPQGVSYLPIPIAGALIALFSLEHLLVLLSGRPTVIDREAKVEALVGGQ